MTTLDPERIPQHIAIIMDGNGRWAKARGLDRSLGHQEGAATVRDITEEASNLGVTFLTLYTFAWASNTSHYTPSPPKTGVDPSEKSPR